MRRPPCTRVPCSASVATAGTLTAAVHAARPRESNRAKRAKPPPDAPLSAHMHGPNAYVREAPAGDGLSHVLHGRCPPGPTARRPPAAHPGPTPPPEAAGAQQRHRIQHPLALEPAPAEPDRR